MNYINNQDLYNSMVEWKKSNDDKLPKTVVDAIMQICHNLAKSGNSVGIPGKRIWYRMPFMTA